MATSLVDSASEDATAQQPQGDAPQTPPPPPTAARSCANCGAPLEQGQDWCLQCGMARASSRDGGPPWRSGAVLLAATAVLALAAAGAGYAALSKSPPRPRLATVTVASTAPAAAPPAATTPPPAAPASPTATTPKPVLPAPSTLAPAKTPPASVTPPKSTTTPTTSTSTPSGETHSQTTPSPGEPGTEPQENALTLDTNAASSYNPGAYPASDFGDPSLAIDGDVTTGWSALVEPATAPKVGDGLLIDLKTPQKVSTMELVTSTPGMSIQIFGATGATAPTEISDPAWAKLTTSKVDKKKRSQIKLSARGNKYRFVLVWISKAPAAAVGTPQKPGHVVVDELELFP